MSEKIWVRVPGNKKLRKIGAPEVYFTGEPEQVNADDHEIIRRLRQGNLEQVSAPSATVMVDVQPDPKMMREKRGPEPKDKE